MVFDDNVIFAQNFFKVSNGNKYYSNSGISLIGHAIPAAIGARFAMHNPTLAILGDGGFQMCCMELMTAVNYNIPLTVVMFSNATMGLIRKNQFQQYEKRFIDCDFINPDFKLLSRNRLVSTTKRSKEEEVRGLFSELNYQSSINLVEVMIDEDLFPPTHPGVEKASTMHGRILTTPDHQQLAPLYFLTSLKTIRHCNL